MIEAAEQGVNELSPINRFQLECLRRAASIPEEIGCLTAKAYRIPVAIEWPENHRKPGGKVSFLDGHTKYMRYPGEFPMTEPVIEALRALDALGKP